MVNTFTTRPLTTCCKWHLGLGHGIKFVSRDSGSVSTFRRIPHSHRNVETIGMGKEPLSGKVVDGASYTLREVKRNHDTRHSMLSVVGGDSTSLLPLTATALG
jgi:hypothetical protein